MGIRRYGSFAGGIDLPDEKDATLNARIETAAVPVRLRVPLAVTPAAPCQPIVEPGQRVSRGQCIARAEDPDQVDVFAPADGRVGAIVQADLPARHGHWRHCPAIELTDLSDPPPVEELPELYDWRQGDADDLRLRLAEGNLATFRRPVTALSEWVERGLRARVRVLIANVTENVPFITADHRLLAERGAEVVAGLAILARALAAERVCLAVDGGRTGAYRVAVEPARRHGVDRVALPRKYPIGIDAMIVKALLRREMPAEGSPFDVGAAVTNAATCWAVYRWVVCGERPTARVMSLTGPRVNRPMNCWAPFGADAGTLLSSAGAGGGDGGEYGSPMVGLPIAAEAVTGPACDGLVALKAAPARSPTPCIRCSWCNENCPARLNVAGLNDDFELSRVDRAARRGATACVNCGICSYLCPARLPLTQRVAALKQAIRLEQELPEHVDSDR